MTSKAVTREQFEIRSELEVVHISTGTVFRVQPYIDPGDRVQSIKGWGRAGVPTGDYFKQVQSMAAQLLLERAVGDRWLGKQIEKDWEAAMAWAGRTNFSEIGVGTSLRLEESPTIPGRSPSPVRATTIISVADNEIQMKLPDGTVWQMTHRTPFDPPVEIKSPGLNQQDWVVRSAQPFVPSSRGR